MDPWLQSLITALVGIFAGSGFWAWLSSRSKSNNAWGRLLLGLAYDKIATMGMHYIDRGWITKDEYEEFRKYLYEPYKELGGNGTADQVMEQMKHLPWKSYPRYVAAPGRRSKGEG